MTATLNSNLQNISTTVKLNNDLCYFSRPKSGTDLFQVKKQIPFSFSNLPFTTADISFSVYSNSISFKVYNKTNPGHTPPKRTKDDISRFTANSRRRLLQLLSKINLTRYSLPSFITFTFHNVYPDNSEKLKKLIDNYIKSIRRIDPNINFVYRLEWQKRGAPHFHFMFFYPTWYDQKKIESIEKKLKSKWFFYLDDHDYYTFKYSVDIIKVNDKKKVFSYLSKYTAKIENESEMAFKGRRWSCSKSLNFSPLATAVTDFYFILHLKKTFWKYIKNKFKNISELEQCFFDFGTITVLLSEDESNMLIKESLLTYNPG